MNISKVLESSGVSRFHAVPGLAQQTIAQHSWGVAILCQYFNPMCRKELILSALTHDCTELITGDIPATAKWESNELKVILDQIESKTEQEWGIQFQLDDDEKRLLKLCDGLEGMNYCIERRKLGELEASTVFYRWANFITGKFALNKQERDFYNDLVSLMKDARDGRTRHFDQKGI